MAETVDSLSIELTASTESAESSIDRLIGKLNQLKGAVAGASNFNRVVQGIARIAAVASGIDGDAGRKLNHLAAGLTALSKVGNLDNLKGAGKNLASVMKAVSGETGGKGLSGLADGIKQTNDALGSIKDSDVSRLGAIRDTLAGEVSGPLHTSERVSESAALGGMGAPEPSFGNMAAYGAMTVFRYTADSIRDATAAYQEFRAAIGGGMPPIFTDFADSAAQAGESVRMLTGSVGGGQEGPWEADEIRDAAKAYDDLGGSASRAANVIETEFADTEKATGGLAGLRDTLRSIGGYIANDVTTVFTNIGNAIKNFASSVLRIARYRMIRSMIRTITEGFSEGKKNLYEWSQAMDGRFAASMDRLATSTQYLKNSLGTLVGPLMEALEPALTWIIDALVTVINYFNMFVAAISGKSTYTAAVRAATSWGGAVSNAAGNASNAVSNAVDDMKRTIMGFDEINKLNDVADSGSGGGGSGGGGSGGGVSAMFEERPLSGGFQDFGNAIETALQDSLSRITLIVGAAELAVGAILALSGANVPLGIALMATGAVTMGSAIFANWEGIPDEIKLVVGAIEAALGGGLAVGAVLAFSTGHIGLGIGLMVAALSTEFSAVTVVWTTLKDKIEGQIQAISVLLGGASFGIGAVLAFAGHPGLGIAMMIAGASVAAVSINWNYLKEKLEGPIGAVTALISGASLALGILALISGNIPIGLGLILAGTAGLATTVAANWDNLVNIGKTAIEKVKEGWETIKELVVNAVVSLVKKVGEWASDVWEFITNGKDTIFKTISLIAGSIVEFAGGIWDFVLDAKDTIFKKISLMAGSIAEFAGGIWDFVLDAKDTIFKKISLIGGSIADFAGGIWDFVLDAKETVFKKISLMAGSIAEFAGGIWDFVLDAKDTIFKKISLMAGSIADFAGGIWDFVLDTKETVAKTIQLGMDKAASWIDSIVDFILGPESTDKKANIALALENTALAIVNFLRDPGSAVKDVILSITAKMAESVKTIWDYITGVTSEAEVDIDGNVTIKPKAGTGLTDKGNGQFSLTNDVAGTTVLSPTKSDNWQQEWDELVGDELDVKVKMNVVKGNVEDSIKTWFNNAGGTITTTISTLLTKGGTWINEAWTALTAGDKNVTTTQSVNRGAWDDNAFSALQVGAANVARAISQAVNKGSWDDSAYAATGIPAVDNLARKVTQAVVQGDWNKSAYAATDIEAVSNLARKVTQAVVQGKWDDTAYKATSIEKNSGLDRTVNQTVKKGGSWSNTAYSATKINANNGLKRSVSQSMSKGAWSDSAYNAAQMKSSTITKVVQVSVKADPNNNRVIVKPSTQGDGSVKVEVAALGGVLKNGVWRRIAQFANGGIFSNGFWKSIPQYAGGTTNAHGSMFLAGEAGPELVGHLGGRTEVLNQSQLAATMFSAVRAAMGGVKIGGTFYNGDVSGDPEADYETMYRAMYDAFTDAMAGSNERDREKVALMRQIAAKEFTAEVTANSVNRAQTRMNRRAGNTIVPVGT